MKKSGVAEIIYYLKCYPLLRRTPSAEDLKVNGGAAVAEVEEGAKNDGEEEEKKEVARREPGGWKTMPYIIGNETFEKVASFGLTANFTVYLVKFYNMRQVSAVNFLNIWSGTANFAPLLGAFLADAYWGKYKTLAVACIATLVGMIFMTSTAIVKEFRPQSCSTEMQQLGQCMGPNAGQMTVLILALAFLSIGAAGVRPCSLPFGMDQFDRTSEKGRKGMNSYFNWYYTTNTAAVMVALTVVVYVQDSISWAWGLGLPTVLMLLAVILFFVGTRYYIYIKAEGSIFSSIVQVFVAAFKKRSLKLPSPEEQELSLYNPPLTGNPTIVVKLPLSQQYRFLNKAAIKLDGEVNPDNELPLNVWRLSSVQRVEEVKCLIRIIPIWASGITCFVAIGQQWTIAVLQAFTMDRHLGPHFEVPPGSLGVFSLLSIVVFLPIYDRILVPALRKITKHEGGITLLQRMGVGIFISALSMVVAGVVEAKRRESALANGGRQPMSVFWLVPQLAMVGISEAFNAVGQIEFYNQQFPDQMRSLATSLFSCSLAGASYLSSIVVTLVHQYTGKNGSPNWLDNNVNAGRIDYFYYILAIMGGVNLLYFLVVAHFYHYKGVPEVEGSIRALF